MLVDSIKSKELISVLKQQGCMRMPGTIYEFSTSKSISGITQYKQLPAVSDLLETAGQYSEVLIRNSFTVQTDFLFLAAVLNVKIIALPNECSEFSFYCSLCEYAIGYYRTKFIIEKILGNSHVEKCISGDLIHKIVK